jgi:hypothetical protein
VRLFISLFDFTCLTKKKKKKKTVLLYVSKYKMVW